MKSVNYLNRDFESLKLDLINYVKNYHQDKVKYFNPNSPDMEVRSFDHITECTTFDEAVKHFMEQLLWFDFNYIDIRTNKNQILFESLRP